MVDETACCKVKNDFHYEEKLRMDLCKRYSQVQVLKELLADEVREHHETEESRNKLYHEIDELRDKLCSIRRIIEELTPGQRLTKEVLNKLNQMK